MILFRFENVERTNGEGVITTATCHVTNIRVTLLQTCTRALASTTPATRYFQQRELEISPVLPIYRTEPQIYASQRTATKLTAILVGPCDEPPHRRHTMVVEPTNPLQVSQGQIPSSAYSLKKKEGTGSDLVSRQLASSKIATCPGTWSAATKRKMRKLRTLHR